MENNSIQGLNMTQCESGESLVRRLCDRWLFGELRVSFHPFRLAGVLRRERTERIAEECTEVILGRLGRRNLLGSVRENLDELLPIILEIARKHGPTF